MTDEGRRAHNLFNKAIRDGKLIRANACERCGAIGDGLHGHHPDYSKPLDVIWLCPKCHRGIHAKDARKKRLTTCSTPKTIAGGARLRRRRQDLGMTAAMVASAVGVSTSSVSQWERGETEPSAAKRPKLAKLLKVPVFSALYEGGEP